MLEIEMSRDGRIKALEAVKELADSNDQLQAQLAEMRTDFQSALQIAYRNTEMLLALRKILGNEALAAVELAAIGMTPEEFGSVGERMIPPGLNPGSPENGLAGSNPAASAIPFSGAEIVAAADVADIAGDIVALWESPHITELPRADRNAAIEDTRKKLIDAVHAWERAKLSTNA